METAFLVLVIALFVLAVFDLMVGVSNDAVNFLNSAIGSKAAPFWGIMLVAAVGVFVGASTSNGMMDIARHGVFHPQYFSLNDLMCIFLAVMLTDVILLDVFNSMGMPTSTTVSMVFELLGGAFMIALLKLVGEPGLDLGSVLNTEKALTMIMGIFISVAIAFFFGLLVQYITRLLFSFQYKKNMKWFGGLFGGISLTAIVYFVLIKGAKNMTIMTPDVKDWIHDNTLMLVMACFVGFTVLMHGELCGCAFGWLFFLYRLCEQRCRCGSRPVYDGCAERTGNHSAYFPIGIRCYYGVFAFNLEKGT